MGQMSITKIFLLCCGLAALLGLSFYPFEYWLPFQEFFPVWFTSVSFWELLNRSSIIIVGGAGIMFVYFGWRAVR